MESIFNNGGVLGKSNTPLSDQASGVWNLEKIYSSQINKNWPSEFNKTLSDKNSFNLVGDPLDIHDWSSSASTNAATQTRDTSVTDSPFGGVPVRMDITGGDPHFGTYNGSQWNIDTAADGETWEVRVLAKASTPTTGEIFIFGVDSNGTFLGGFGTNFGATGFSIGTDWTECSFSFTFNDTNVAFIQTRLDGTQSGGSGISIWWDGLRVYKLS